MDYLGTRTTKHGHVGQTLVDVCRMYGMDLLECDTVHGGGHRYEIIHNDVWTEDVFGESATPDQLMEKYGLTKNDIVKAAEKAIARKG